MKKVLLGLLLVLTVTLTGCDQVEETVTDLQTKLTTVTTDLGTAIDTINELDETLETAETTIEGLQISLTTATTALETNAAALTEANEQIAELEAEIALTNTKIKNALNRDTWKQRKVSYNPDWSTNNDEYCLGVFDVEDWSTLPDDAFKTVSGTTVGLKFVLTITSISSGYSTEIFATDSCGNYSDFLNAASAYGFYSAPAGYFEVGETYEVILYKDVYFAGSPAQLGFLPAADMAEFGAYPTDLSGLSIVKK